MSVVEEEPNEDTDKVAINCFEGDIPAAQKQLYEIPKVDEYYDDISFWDNLCFFSKYSDGAILGHSFDEEADPPSKTVWEDVFRDTAEFQSDNLRPARDYFQGMIAKPVYDIENIRKLQNPPPAILSTVNINDWEEVDIANLGNKNQILSALLGDNFDGDTSDMWCSLIAFSGYGSHRTGPIKKDENHPDAYFVNDVTFLGQYAVRKGYVKYGAAAYFDSKYHLKEIFLSHTGQTYKPPGDNSATIANDWLHAKWCWKVFDINIYSMN